MKMIELSYPHSLKRSKLPPTVATIGFFDGIHKGHQKLITTTVQEAQKRKLESALITFHPHPSVVLEGKQSMKYLTPKIEKQILMKEYSLDRLYMITFNRDLSQLSPQTFIDHFVKGLHIEHLIAGFDFTFGYRGEGNMDNMSHYAKDHFTYTTIDKVQFNEQKVSSTNIRKALMQGQVKQVKHLLGRFYEVMGTVVHGDGRGRKIGFPTANININADKLLPQLGVYAVRVTIEQKMYHGMANVGVRPTFTDEKEPTVEVYLFDFENDIYGKDLSIEFIDFVREEKKFSNVDEIVAQLQRDEKKVRCLFSES